MIIPRVVDEFIKKEMEIVFFIEHLIFFPTSDKGNYYIEDILEIILVL
jgi:hypothetical protein